REIGRGGLGAVYLAARADDEYRKEVALKLIRRGLDTDDILRRFRTERQILAQLDHPNIARLLDGGTTDDGLPYFAMEYVRGEPINTYCDLHRLKLSERLELFRKVCAAVTYAHQNLVVHRDLKPSNILVTADGEPKLLDFGIAKLLSADHELVFTQTAPGLRAMTPDYASPEQMKGEKITTASDVYSLGVLLYEVLSGQKPYRVKTRTTEEISRAVTEQEPQRPSTAAATDGSALRGDLDNIVLKALRKEPERRYSSVEGLAEDLRRYQEGRPVLARPRTFTYRSSKFIRRNKVAVLAATLVLLAILGGLIATEQQARIARAERAKAEKRFNDVRDLANSDLFDVYPEIENLEGSLKAREKIVQNALNYLDSLSKEAGGDLALQSELATAYEKVGDVQGALNTSSLGKIKAGLDSYAKAAVLRKAVVAELPNDLAAKKQLANNIYVTARTLWNDSQTAEAEEAFEEALKLQRELVAARPDSVEFKNRLAVLLIDYGAIPVFNFQAEKAIVLFEEGLEIIRALRQQAPDDAELKKTRARGLRAMSKAKGAFGDHAGGLMALQEALALSEELARQFPQDFRLQRSVWLTKTVTCELLIDKGDGAEAVRSCDRTIEFPKVALQNEPENGVVAFDLAISHFNAARAHRLAGNFPGTITQAEAAIAVMSTLSAKSPRNLEYKRNLAIYRTELARAQLELDQPQAALVVLNEVRETLRPIVEADPRTTTYQYDLGFAHRLAAQASSQTGDKNKAREHVEQAIAIVEKLRELNALRDSDKNLLAELEQEKAEYSR
ncbi:MAG TPA: protein kinase, partial [Chthoniobacterales bacterium]|nr:protein kinase [Chthoniobacterales bacterium]